MPKPIQARCLKDLDGIRHGFFTREGGVSEGIYAGLNCGLGSADRREAVIENRARVARRLGAAGEHVVTLHQTHSATAHVVDGPIPRERLPRADAVVTATPGLAIGALAADCAPVLFADVAAGIVAAAHAGWRGAVAGVVEAAVAAMVELGAQRERIRAAVGPCIGPAAYEVGPEFEVDLLARDPASARFFSREAAGARPRFDLPGYVEHRLHVSGLAAVERCAPCTYRNESLFFSYRRSRARGEPDYGRQISAIVVA
jgi:YfiH family protein